jgi:hypothetical protein
VTTVVVTHSVGDMDTWLKGGAERKATFSEFSSSHRIFQHADGKRIAIVAENVDLDKMKSALSTAEATAIKEKHTVINPLDVYIEVEGGQ